MSGYAAALSCFARMSLKNAQSWLFKRDQRWFCFFAIFADLVQKWWFHITAFLKADSEARSDGRGRAGKSKCTRAEKMKKKNEWGEALRLGMTWAWPAWHLSGGGRTGHSLSSCHVDVGGRSEGGREGRVTFRKSAFEPWQEANCCT